MTQNKTQKRKQRPLHVWQTSIVQQSSANGVWKHDCVPFHFKKQRLNVEFVRKGRNKKQQTSQANSARRNILKHNKRQSRQTANQSNAIKSIKQLESESNQPGACCAAWRRARSRADSIRRDSPRRSALRRSSPPPDANPFRSRSFVGFSVRFDSCVDYAHATLNGSPMCVRARVDGVVWRV